MNQSTAPTIIVGGGFAGLFTALHLHRRHYSHPVILVDPQERFVFKPLLYDYVSGEMEVDQVLPPYRELLRDRQITFVQDRVTAVNLDQRQITLAGGDRYDYQHLVLTVGSSQGYFGTDGAKQHAFALRTRTDVITLRNHLQDCLEQARQTDDPKQRQRLLTFAVVGAGPSGVEITATLADLLPMWWCRLFNSTDKRVEGLRLVLLNHGDCILEGDANAALREPARKQLQQRLLPPELKLGVKVKAVSENQLTYQQQGEDRDQTLATATTIWTAGTANNSLLDQLPLSEQQRDHHGRPIVTRTLQLPDYPEVFAAGDCAMVQADPQPQLAQVAYQQGKAIADNLIAIAQNTPPQPATINIRGSLMKMGIDNGIAHIFKQVQIKGKPGSLIRDATYLELLPTPGHNLKVTGEWLSDEFLHRYHSPWIKSQGNVASSSRSNQLIDKFVGLLITLLIVMLGGFFLWKMLTYEQSQPSTRQSTPESTR